jgi:ribonuclease HII
MGRVVVAGVDEVGRGPMAGPVVAAAVVLPAGARNIRGLDDSKRLTAEQREALFPVIRQRAAAIAVAAASVHEIDRFNIRQASILAMRRALERLPQRPEHILIDGLPIPELGMEHEAIIDGDARCQSIAAASVIAKVIRDRLMDRLSIRHPGYHWESNKGYCTDEHTQALALLGATKHHRHSFEPVAQLTLIL